jgi:alpha-galactosidase
VLDPRYKEVRDFLVGTYVDAVKRYDLDGLKIDFVDRFNSNGKVEEGMDFTSVEDATERLLIDITSALKAIKPNMLIEFRQPYFGPVISSYGNMIRVWDCPLNSVVNKNATIDLRLVSSSCAVHSDMIYWSKNDTPENVATQLWGTMLSVPQISNLYSDTTPEQRRVLKNYLDFWMAHKDTLMNGRLQVTLSENGYGYATVSDADKKISLAICEAYFDSTDGYGESHMINLTGKDRIILKADRGAFVETFDCQGRRIGQKRRVKSTLTELCVPHTARIRVTKK